VQQCSCKHAQRPSEIDLLPPLCYAQVTNLCGGFLATRYSAKGVLALGVVVWSCFTIATPSAAAADGGLWELMVARGVMGLGEGVSMPRQERKQARIQGRRHVCVPERTLSLARPPARLPTRTRINAALPAVQVTYPSVQNLVRAAVPSGARSRALAFIYSGHQMGTIGSYVAAPLLISQYGWQSVFWVFGSLGFVWMLGWLPLLRHESEQRKELAAAGGAAAPPALRVQDVPWARFAQNKAVWAIVAAQASKSSAVQCSGSDAARGKSCNSGHAPPHAVATAWCRRHPPHR
jgi:ACS family sodium-dependent inorganic phosphate cotransporter